MVKVSSLQATKAHEGARTLGRGRVASPTLGRLLIIIIINNLVEFLKFYNLVV